MFEGINLGKGDGNLGAKALSDENILGLVCCGILPGGAATYTVLGTSVKLIQPSDADALGFTAAYDITNKVLIRYHIDEFFRINPEGVLWLQVVAQTTTLTQMADKTLNFAKKLVNDSLKAVKTIGLVRNPAVGYISTLTGGLDNDVNTAIPKAQELVDDFATQNVYINSIVIEGREVNGVIGSIGDQRTAASPNVHVAILQDKDVANLDALFAKHAAVGTLLGSIGIRRVEEDYGTINVANNPDKGAVSYPLNDAATAKWLNPAISSGTLVSALTVAEVKTLKDRAYIFADSYPEFEGVYLVGSAACTALTSDFAYGVITRVWNRGARIFIKKIIPKMNSTVETDANGFISSITAASWKEDVNNPRNGLGTLVVDGHAQETDAFIPPNQPIVTNSTVDMQMSIKTFAYARKITGTLSVTI